MTKTCKCGAIEDDSWDGTWCTCPRPNVFEEYRQSNALPPNIQITYEFVSCTQLWHFVTSYAFEPDAWRPSDEMPDEIQAALDNLYDKLRNYGCSPQLFENSET